MRHISIKEGQPNCEERIDLFGSPTTALEESLCPEHIGFEFYRGDCISSRPQERNAQRRLGNTKTLPEEDLFVVHLADWSYQAST